MRALTIVAAGAILALAIRATTKPRLSDAGNLAGYGYFVRRIGGAQPTTDAPVIVLLHGFGDDPGAAADRVLPLIQGPAHVVVPRGKNKGPKWWTLRASAEDQEELAEQMQWATGDFRPFLEVIVRHFGRRPILVGHSQGAMFATALATRWPGLVDRAVVAASWLPPLLRRAGAPVLVVHGVRDSVIPYPRTQMWIQGAAADGAPVELTSVDASHLLQGELLSSWTDAIQDTMRG